MQKNDRRYIYILLIIIIISSTILIYKIKTEPKYNQELYDEIYREYELLEEKVKELDNIEDIYENANENEEKITSENGSSIEAINTNVITSIDKENENLKTNYNLYNVIGKINIPEIKVKYPIIYETTEEYLKIAPTKFCGPNINEPGNLCIVGHNYKNEEFFSNLHKLEKNDMIILTNEKGKELEYRVYDKYTVAPNDLTCTNQETNGKIELTLITCTNSKNKRLVVKCIAK